jgi:uncharacterized protein (TIGR02246 family)
MDALEELQAKQACAELMSRYALAVNSRDVEGFVGLFTPDGEWNRPGGHSMRGHEQIRAYIDHALVDPTVHTLRHVNGAALVEVDGPARATCWSQTTVYDVPQGPPYPVPLTNPDMVVEYRDLLLRRNDRWLIRRRDTTVVFAARGLPDVPEGMMPQG